MEYNVLLAGVNDASRCHRLALEIESSLTDALGSVGAMEKLAKKMQIKAGKAGDGGAEGSGGSGSVLRPALDAFMSNAEVGLYKLNAVDPYLESTRFPTLSLIK